MNADLRKTTTVDELQIFDDFEVAGVMYRVDTIEKIDNSYVIQVHNARRPSIEAVITLERNTLMHIQRPA